MRFSHSLSVMLWMSVSTADSLANPPRTRQRSTSTRRNAPIETRLRRLGFGPELIEMTLVGEARHVVDRVAQACRPECRQQARASPTCC